MYFDAEIDNFAQDGLTTEQQLEQLNEDIVKNSISEADIVCISIGGNDLLSIFEQAIYNLNSNENTFFKDDGLFNVSPEFIQSFVMDYSSSFSSAAIKASENIEIIKNKIKEINPDAELIMQTVYIPFESSDEKTNTLYKPLKVFASLYIGNINSAIKNAAPNLADINLKFNEKPYIYTNIDKFDIHPNYLGHMLIAEEIIQTLGISGNYSVFKTASDEIPHGIFSQFPDYISKELDEFSNGQMRRGTLEQAIERTSVSPTETQDTSEKTENTVNTTAAKDKEKKGSKSRGILSVIFLILGFTLILLTALRKLIKNKKGKNK